MSASRLAGWPRLVALSARLIAGRWYGVLPLLPLLWLAFQALRLFSGGRLESFAPVEAQNALIAAPLTVLAIALGLRVIAGEIDRRSLEIAYTVPGGSRRVWLAKLAAALLILVVAEALLAGGTFFLFTSFPAGALYGALQGAVFYLVAAMGLAALARSEVAGALLTVALLAINSMAAGGRFRVSPFFNPLLFADVDPAEVAAWTVQNRIGFVLAIAGCVALAFARAERREKMLGG